MRPGRTYIVILIAVIIYIIGLALGIFLICFLPERLERKNTDRFVKERILEYKAQGSVSNWSNSGVAVIIYNSDGSFGRFFGQGSNMFSMSYYDQSSIEVEKVLSGENVSRIYVLVKDHSSLGFRSRIYEGRRMDQDGRTYAFFWVKELGNLPEILFGYIIAFSIVYFVALAVVIMGLKRQDRYTKLQKQYIDNITHELKTPVASVKAITEALSDQSDIDENTRTVYYGMILSETNQQQRMIQEALTLSKLQNKIMEVKLDAVDLREVFDHLYEKYSMLCELAEVNFAVEIETDPLPDLYANKEQLIRVISTLIDNALKYVPENGTIRLAAKAGLRNAVISVEDNGSGIPAEDLPYVFERFYRAQRNDGKSGSGLGLAIAKELVVAMKGKIWIESEEGSGTKVFIMLRTSV